MKYKIKSVKKVEIIDCSPKTYHFYENGKRIYVKTAKKEPKGTEPK